jgi:hypothetical protein
MDTERPLINFMETVQNDSTPSMQGILVDWLVEVCGHSHSIFDEAYISYDGKHVDYKSIGSNEEFIRCLSMVLLCVLINYALCHSTML